MSDEYRGAEQAQEWGGENRRKPQLETVADFEAMLHRAARHGAREALREIGLGDEGAGADVRELRTWLGNMRLFRRAFRDTTAKVFAAGFWIVLLGGLIQYVREHLK